MVEHLYVWEPEARRGSGCTVQLDLNALGCRPKFFSQCTIRCSSSYFHCTEEVLKAKTIYGPLDLRGRTMPSLPRLNQKLSQAKKQQSISSFFTKTPPSVSPAAPPVHETSPRENGRVVSLENGAKSRDCPSMNSDEDNLTSQQSWKRSKRALAGNDELDQLANDNEDTVIPLRKRLRISETSEVHAEPIDQVHSTDSLQATIPRPEQTQTNQQTRGHKPNDAKITEKTARYLFSDSPTERMSDDEESLKRKERLHLKFVRKLGRPDSIAEIKRRNWYITEETAENQLVAQDDGDEYEQEVSTRSSKMPGLTLKKGVSKLTPMEKQILEIKRQHMDTILAIEVGYKYRFFGEDARTAAKELSIVCIPGKFRYDEHPSEAHLDRFASASIPVPRLHVHVKRLVSAGHKVGIVRQLETAALKAIGDNRNTPFVRKLTNLYTKGTYIDDINELGESVQSLNTETSNTGYLLCITESRIRGLVTDERVHIGIVAVQPATGDVIYDGFDDGFMRSETETRLLHIAPCELLIVGEMSKPTEKLVRHLSGNTTNVFGDKVRVERIGRSKTMAAQAYTQVSNFYAKKMRVSSQEGDEKHSALLEKVLKLEDDVTICLSAMITHLSDYGLEHVFELTKYFQSFSARSHMNLNGTTLTSLEIYRNQTDHTERGSLFWALDRTQTRFGQRLLRKWVGRPLLDTSKLIERIDAVEELKDGEKFGIVDKIKHLLSKTKGDLEKSLIRIYYGKCNRPELLTVLQTMQRIATEFATIRSTEDFGFRSSMINEAIAALPAVADDVVGYLQKINPQAAKADDRYTFFLESEETGHIQEQKLELARIEEELDSHRAVAAKKIKQHSVVYVSVAKVENQIEVSNAELKNVPASWVKVSGTKKVSRFHTPEVLRLIRERDQHKEALAVACDVAFSTLLADISSRYQTFRDCIQALATLDCLLSLATVAMQPGYVKPVYTDDICITVGKGRHPMVEQLLLNTYVPNDIDLASDRTRALLITGPNMGGKSSYVRQVALIAIMGQIGSYVPAESAKLGMLDAIFTRMGAFDNVLSGESTFMVELSETSDILKQATPRSLVILDELGRGTSTHDGVAIASAVLAHLVKEIKSLALFITHYQSLSTMVKSFDREELRNVHMRFTEAGEDRQDITFLYEIGEGVSHRSYG